MSFASAEILSEGEKVSLSLTINFFITVLEISLWKCPMYLDQ